MWSRGLVFIFLIVLVSCGKGKNNPESCNGKTRREVKLAIDSRSNEIDSIPIVTTIDSIGNIEVPEVEWETGRQDVELKIYSIYAKVDEVDKARDGDYHIRLTDGDTHMITEVPNPGCSWAKSSKYFHRFVTVRKFLEENDIEGKSVWITGIAFIDIDHHYRRKQAPNNLELHPVLDIHF